MTRTLGSSSSTIPRRRRNVGPAGSAGHAFPPCPREARSSSRASPTGSHGFRHPAGHQGFPNRQRPQGRRHRFGPDTRKALVKAYMGLDDFLLCPQAPPLDARVRREFPAGPGTARTACKRDPDNRRVESSSSTGPSCAGAPRGQDLGKGRDRLSQRVKAQAGHPQHRRGVGPGPPPWRA